MAPRYAVMRLTGSKNNPPYGLRLTREDRNVIGCQPSGTALYETMWVHFSDGRFVELGTGHTSSGGYLPGTSVKTGGCHYWFWNYYYNNTHHPKMLQVLTNSGSTHQFSIYTPVSGGEGRPFIDWIFKIDGSKVAKITMDKFSIPSVMQWGIENYSPGASYGPAKYRGIQFLASTGSWVDLAHETDYGHVLDPQPLGTSCCMRYSVPLSASIHGHNVCTNGDGRCCQGF